MKMSLENWVINRWLEQRAADREEISRLLAVADGHLDDYLKAVASEMPPDSQLSLAYDAIRASSTAALRAAGYRVVRGNNEHYRTLDALEFSIDPERKLISMLDALRRKRNTGAYDDYGLVSQGEAIKRENWRFRFANRSKTGFAKTTPTRSDCAQEL
jgi:hypothetical protein